MTEKLIPEHIDPFRFAEQGLSIAGVVRVADMPRLKLITLSQEGVAEVELQFNVDNQGTSFLKGSLKVELVLQCQRCMEPFIYETITHFVLGIVKTLDEANDLPDCYEPALAVANSLALRELIEDEIILNLPIIPRHELQDCQVKLPITEVTLEEERSKNPFSVLQSLKKEKQ